MKADFDLNPDGTVFVARGRPDDAAPPGRGGARAGAGRKPDGYEKPQVAKDFDTAKARKETALADMHELNFKIKSGEFVSRAAMREASATLLATLAQSLRSLPDNLERKYALAPETAESIERDIDSALADVAAGLALFTDESAAG